jgi:glutamyl-Q tRNA(Asp) synthetase
MNFYRGRFAPSPTGPLHFGSLVAALGSWLDARKHGGEWLVRMEDIDWPRRVPGASDAILATLEACGLEWDGEVLYQSRRTDIYTAALQQLQTTGRLFPCGCSRKEVADSALPGPPTLAGSGELIYPGTCRHGLAAGRMPRAWRINVTGTTLTFDDAIQGHIRQDLEREVGDFVVKRADGLFAYQLAVVVDDAAQGITDVVRGADLLDSTPRQLLLQQLLGLAQPRYAHLPVAVNTQGEKLSKQTFAQAISNRRATDALFAALQFLGQSPPKDLAGAPAPDILDWARSHWSITTVPKSRALPSPM